MFITTNATDKSESTRIANALLEGVRLLRQGDLESLAQSVSHDEGNSYIVQLPDSKYHEAHLYVESEYNEVLKLRTSVFTLKVGQETFGKTFFQGNVAQGLRSRLEQLPKSFETVR